MVTKTESLSSLVKELDILISRYVRLTAADDNGQCRCISCNCKMYWALMDCAHYINRQHMATRYYLPNLTPACKSCNEFNGDEHRISWRDKMTPEQCEDLELRHQSLMKWTRPELEEQIEHYKTEVKNLRKLKHL